MNIFRNKKRGFTIAEIVVAVFIVAILAAILIPMATSQLKRGEEYRYYMTYKTLEKIAKQIIAEPIYGNDTALDPSNLPKIASAPNRVTFEQDSNIFKNTFDNTTDIITNILIPPAYATYPDHDYKCCKGQPPANWDSCTPKNGWIWNGVCYSEGDYIPEREDVRAVDLFEFNEYGELWYYEQRCHPEGDILLDGVNAVDYPENRHANRYYLNRCSTHNEHCYDYTNYTHGTTGKYNDSSTFRFPSGIVRYGRRYASSLEGGDNSICKESNSLPNGNQDQSGYTGFRTIFLSLISPIIPYIDWEKFERRLKMFYFDERVPDGQPHAGESALWWDLSDTERQHLVAISDIGTPYCEDAGTAQSGSNRYVTDKSYCQYERLFRRKHIKATWWWYYWSDNNALALDRCSTDRCRRYSNIKVTTGRWDCDTPGKSSCSTRSVMTSTADSGGAGAWVSSMAFQYLPAIVIHKDSDLGSRIEYTYGAYGNAADRGSLKIGCNIINAPLNLGTDIAHDKIATSSYDRCLKDPYIYMEKDSYTQNCVCKPNYIQSRNDAKACVNKAFCTAPKVPYYSRILKTYKCCIEGGYNPTTGTCCGDNQIYTGNGCTDITNPYIPVGYMNDAKELCNKIASSWNVKDAHCDEFSKYSSSELSSKGWYYNILYNAINGNDRNKQNSINNLKNGRGWFAQKRDTGDSRPIITPNIEFSNGIRLWMLGDREASMSGLSYPLHEKDVKTTRAMCYNYRPYKIVDSSTAKNLKDTYCKGTSNGMRYCPGENRCYHFGATTYNKIKNILPDARSCCLNYSIEDNETLKKYNPVSGFTVYADINGDGGTGTLWDDVFPFYITTTGYVIPGYPIDASTKPARDNTPTVYMGGNSSSYLPVDVYYHKLDGMSKKRVLVASNISFARGACISGLVPDQTYYCHNIFNRGSANETAQYEKERNICASNGVNCMLSVKKKTRLF